MLTLNCNGDCLISDYRRAGADSSEEASNGGRVSAESAGGSWAASQHRQRAQAAT